MSFRHHGARPLTARTAMAMLLLPVAACSFLRTATGIGFEHPDLVYQSWSADELDLDGITIALHYRLENPNDFSLDLRRLEYRLEVEDRQVAAGQIPTSVQLQARGATPLTFPIRLRWRDVPGLLETFVTRSEVAYRVRGTAGIGSPIGMVAIPFEHRDRLALPRLPAIGASPGDRRHGGAAP